VLTFPIHHGLQPQGVHQVLEHFGWTCRGEGHDRHTREELTKYMKFLIVGSMGWCCEYHGRKTMINMPEVVTELRDTMGFIDDNTS